MNNVIYYNDWQSYLDEINKGYISIRSHPENKKMMILNYTNLTTFEKHWNKYTMSARGLIVDLTNTRNDGKIRILAKPFEKFFNFGENLDYESNINFDEIESITEKLDGSLGISYPINGEIRFATRGSFTSEQAKKAINIWRRNDYQWKYRKLFGNENPTLLVEIIYPENRIVVDYKEEKLVLLGVISNGKDLPYNEVKQIGEYIGLPVAKQYNYTIDDLIELKKKISSNEEGWVIKFKNGKRLKIKGDNYLMAHKAIFGISDKEKVKAWAEDKIDDIIMITPEEFRSETEKLKQDLDELANNMKKLLDILFIQAKQSAGDNKKEFALYINTLISKDYRKFLFQAYRYGETPINLIKEHIFKNYQHYLEVIKWKNKNS